MLIKTVVKEILREKAILKTEDNQEIIWPRVLLPKNTTLDSIIMLAITNCQEDKDASKQLAKDILNEILNT